MGKLRFINKDLNGDVIDQRPKDSVSIEINGQSRFCGHRFLLKTKLYGDKRCIYCGIWFHWKIQDKDKWIEQKNIDTYNLDNVLEPLHCGSEHCQDYHYRWQEAKKKRMLEQEEKENRFFSLYKKLNERKLVI